MIYFISLKETTKNEREKFDCGNESLNEYFARYAKQDEKKLLCKCYIAKQRNEVIGFFTLSAASICINKNIKIKTHYTDVPVALLGRLAVDKRFQKCGIGKVLLAEAIKRSYLSALGVCGLLVQAKDECVCEFYKRLGFISQENDPLKLFLSFKGLDLSY